MTLQELYQEIGGNYCDIKGRLCREEKIEKFVLMFLKDHSCQTLLRSLKQQDIEEAFRAVHTLKGVSMNLSFDGLYRISARLTEYLREKNIQKAEEVLPEFISCYEKHYDAIREYEKSRTVQKG